ncbi:hypothetical protein CP8484711_1147B, partial [Chlamydia psittaci 84-8471/1]
DMGCGCCSCSCSHDFTHRGHVCLV